MMKGRIVNIYAGTSQSMYSVKGRQSYSNNGFGYYNGAGAFCSYPESHLYLKVVVYTLNGNVTRTIDIRPYVKDKTNGRRLTANYINKLKQNNCGKKIYVIPDPVYEGEYDLYDYGCLNLEE